MLETVFRSEDLPVADRFDWWREMACQTHVPTMVRSDREKDFRGTLRVLDFGVMQLSAMTHPALRVRRNWKEIRRSDPETYCLTVPSRGAIRFGQSGREAELGPRELMLYNSSHPFEGWITPVGGGRVSHMVMQIPAAILPLPADRLGRLTATRLPGGNGIGALLVGHLGELTRQARHFTAADVARLSSLTIDMLAAFFAHHLQAQERLSPETRQQVLRARIRDFVQRRLGDPDLTADTIAAAHHISTRYLYKIFHEEGVSVARWIRHLRLEHCRRDLVDPRLLSRPIHAIAARWGFPDAAHFSRLFRAAYGVPPRDYRVQCAETGKHRAENVNDGPIGRSAHSQP